jgi:hypothetical protein
MSKKVTHFIIVILVLQAGLATVQCSAQMKKLHRCNGGFGKIPVPTCAFFLDMNQDDKIKIKKVIVSMLKKKKKKRRAGGGREGNVSIKSKRAKNDVF